MLFKTPKYRRHILPWLISQYPNYVFDRRIPWLVFEAIKYLEHTPIESKTIFEYGSGASTLYWLKRGAKCVSVEHDPQWAAKVQKHLSEHPSIDYRIVPPQTETPSTKNRSNDPHAYISNDTRYHAMSFKAYVQQIDEFEDESFDLVLIDGRARPSCIQHACRKVRQGGILILDDSDREYYHQKTGDFLRNFSRISFEGPGPTIPLIWRTDIFVRTPVVL